MKTINCITVATTNPGKLNELKQLFAETGMHIKSLNDWGYSGDFQETGSSFQENARQKALFYAEMFNDIVLADDSGLEVDALNGAPGVYSARFAGVDGNGRDQANNRKLLELMQNIPDHKRTARFRCCLSLVDKQNILLEVDGIIEGCIGHKPHGENGFGYDPLFYIPSEGMTAAELSKETKNVISHRGQALKKLLLGLKTLGEH